MRILKDFKIPNFKFPKIKMKDVENIEEVKVDYEKMKRVNENKKKGPYIPYTYKTVKEIFTRSIEVYKDEEFILQKYDHKEPYKRITYKEFGQDVIALGTAMVKYLNLKDKNVVIIGENQYGWYTSYMAMLCGVGVAVPVDKEIPDGELENLIKRSEAAAVIYSSKKKDSIKKIRDNLDEVEYFIEMNSDNELKGKDIGINNLIECGKKIVKSGDTSFMEIEIDPEEFKVLIFTSGTTSNAKGVMICNRNLANNVNAVSAYVRLNTSDMLFSVLPLHHTYESSIGFLLPMANRMFYRYMRGTKIYIR